jgi:hypothetical protein
MDDDKRDLIRKAKRNLLRSPAGDAALTDDASAPRPQHATAQTRAQLSAICSITMRRFVMVFRPASTGTCWLLCDGRGLLPSDVPSDEPRGTPIVLRGSLAVGAEYGGCPYCKNTGFMKCCNEFACLGATAKRTGGDLYCPAGDHWSRPSGQRLSDIVASLGSKSPSGPLAITGSPDVSGTPRLPAPPRR